MNPRILYLIKRAEIKVTNGMIDALADFNITNTQFIILYFVDHNKGDLSSAQLSRRFAMTPQSMNELVSVLEKKKLLKKKADANHKRILRLHLTEKGVKLLNDCNHILDDLEEDLLQGLTKTEIKTFRKLLGKILTST